MLTPNSKLLSRLSLLSLLMLLSLTVGQGQQKMYGSQVEIVTIYSQNEKYYLKSIPYDDEEPSVRGKTSVYEKGHAIPLYTFERGFDTVSDNWNTLTLSNDGEVIFHVIPWGADEAQEGLHSINIYKHGQLIKSYTETEINGCEQGKERCSLVYNNSDEIVDREKSSEASRVVYKEGVDEKEHFLSDFALFSFDDTVYLTDSKKRVHRFDLQEGTYLGADDFDNVYDQLKERARANKVEPQRFESPTFLKFPKLKNGKDTYQSLADHIGMKSVDLSDENADQYKLYDFTLTGNLFQDGTIEVESIDADDVLPKEKILEFFKSHKFDSSEVPKVFAQWHLREEYFFFRKKDKQLARQEKQQQLVAQRLEREKRLTLDTIEGVYIPQNLGECFVGLDKLLTEVDRKEMQTLSDRREMIRYHLGLGMWLRNNWGLHGGSRLQKYFTDHGITDAEDMSTIILFYYHDWLTGQKESWKLWEKNPNKPYPEEPE